MRQRGKSTKDADKLARAINDAIKDKVPSAADVRAYLERLVDLCADRGKPLRWTTDLGLPVINAYHKPDIRRIEVRLKRRRKRVNVAVGDLEGIIPGKSRDAVTANFVHSVDATLLQMVALAAAAEGIDMVSVHDCFGPTAPHAGRLNEITREQFIRLHKRNLLANVWLSAKRDLPHIELPLPPMSESCRLSPAGIASMPSNKETAKMITDPQRLERILRDAARYRTLKQIFETDPLYSEDRRESSHAARQHIPADEK